MEADGGLIRRSRSGEVLPLPWQACLLPLKSSANVAWSELSMLTFRRIVNGLHSCALFALASGRMLPTRYGRDID